MAQPWATGAPNNSDRGILCPDSGRSVGSDDGHRPAPSHLPAPFPITITDQHTMIALQTLGPGQRATELAHEDIIRMRRGAHDLRPRRQIGRLWPTT